MSTANRGLYSCFPDERQRQLLDLCLSSDADIARASWEKWIAATDLDILEPASSRLLPLAFHRLQALRIDHPEMKRLGGTLRHSWANNLTQRHHLSALIVELDRRGIDHLLLKGLPLAFSVYPNPGARPMDDVDLLVPFERAWETLDMLWTTGCVPLQSPPKRNPARPPDEPLHFQHGTGLRTPAGLSLDLHWFALEDCSHPGADAGFWQRRKKLPGPGPTTWQPAPEDQFLHLCVHGLRASPIGSIRWIADVILLARAHAATFDWNLLLDEARRRHLVVPLRHAVLYLVENFNLAVPAGFPACLRAESSTWLERLAHRGNIQATVTAQSAATWLRYKHMRPDDSAVSRVFTFPRFLRSKWGNISYAAVATHVGRRLFSAILPRD